VRLLYDFYHQQISEHKPLENMKADFDLIGLFHVGDVPGHTQPGTGEIDFKSIFKFLSSRKCEKYISMEFTPTIEETKAVRDTMQLAD
jgi:hydroxypyruvate isomerase